MTEGSLKSRVQRRRERQRRELLLIIFAFALLLGLWLWYYFVYIKTPEYALGKLKAAVKTHDAVTAARYMDMDRILGHAYDDLTDDMLRYDASLTADTAAGYERFYAVIKPVMTDGVKNTFTGWLSTGEWTMPSGADLTKGRQLGIDFERFLERSKLRNTEISSVGKVIVRGQSADVDIKVIETDTGMPFVMSAHMERDNEGGWQVTRLDNYRAYLAAIASRQNRDIADYIAATHGIVEEYNERLAGYQRRFQGITRGAGGYFGERAASAMRALVGDEVIPLLRDRQARLDGVAIPDGAKYLAALRRASTDFSVSAWEHFLTGISSGSSAELNLAHTMMSQAIETDLRITDIIRHNTVSQAIPEIP